MTTRKPPWYHFSLRSLLLFTAFVAVLCSIGVSTDWVVAAVIGAGGVVGRLFAGTGWGLAVGAVTGFVFSMMSIFVCGVFWQILSKSSPQFMLSVVIAAIVGAMIGGGVGGYSIRLLAGPKKK